VPVHVVQRGHCRVPVFSEDTDYVTYLRWLKEAADCYKVDIHAYALMTNHIHILATAGDKEGFTRMM